MSYRIVNKKPLNSFVTMMDIEAPLVAKKAQPGQLLSFGWTTMENGFP